MHSMIHIEAKGHEIEVGGCKNNQDQTWKSGENFEIQNHSKRRSQKPRRISINSWRFTELKLTQSKLPYLPKHSVSITFLSPVFEIIALDSCIFLENHWYICDSHEISKLLAIHNLIYMDCNLITAWLGLRFGF